MDECKPLLSSQCARAATSLRSASAFRFGTTDHQGQFRPILVELS